MTRKKLLFVITKSAWGGAGVYVYDLATSLSEQYDVAVALGGRGPLADRLHAAGIRTIPIPSMARDIGASLDIAAYKELKQIFKTEKPDIVHLNSSKAGGLGALAARMTGVKKIVFTVHGWAYNEPVSPLSKLFRWGASLATLILSHRVITVSHFDNINSPLGIPTTPIHNGLAAREFADRAQARAFIAEKTGIAENICVVGAVGELHPNKGYDVLITAAAAAPNMHVVIMGEGEQRALLENLISKHRLADRVHLLGFVSNAAQYSKGFDIFAMPSRKEGLPYAVLEAGAAGLPVVAAAVGGIPEIIDDGFSGVLVNAADASDLADSLSELEKSPNTRERYGEALQAKVLRDFSLPGMIHKTIAVYED